MAGAVTPTLGFGMDAGSVDALTKAGVRPDYGSLWAGVWLESGGWSGFDGQLDHLYQAGVTPMVQFYYWGNDISQSCLSKGCWSPIHNAWKDQAGWSRLASELAAHLNSHMRGRTAVVVLETEFNKNDVGAYEGLDGMLASKAGYFHSAYPASKVVLGFGNWNSGSWGTFDRAMGASDWAGIQGMRGAARDSAASYLGLANALIDAANTLKGKFGQPVFVTDVALSSHWEPEWLSYQRRTVQSLMDQRASLRNAGVIGVVYRGLYDAPHANTNDYYGEGERHFGVAWAGNRTWKPAMSVWANGVRAERGASSPASSSPGGGAFAATFTIKSPNEWWQELSIGGGHAIQSASVRVGGGPWNPMSRSSWGAWTSSVHTVRGSSVEFLVRDTSGATSQSLPFSWLDGTTSRGSTTGGSASAPPASSSAVEAESFAVRTAGGRGTDGSASGGAYWNLWSNGYLEHTFNAQAGAYLLQIVGRGTSAAGVNPHVVVTVDGNQLGTWDPGAGGWSTWSRSTSLAAGSHVVRVAYVNDARAGTEDRNALLDKVTLVRTG